MQKMQNHWTAPPSQHKAPDKALIYQDWIRLTTRGLLFIAGAMSVFTLAYLLYPMMFVMMFHMGILKMFSTEWSLLFFMTVVLLGFCIWGWRLNARWLGLGRHLFLCLFSLSGFILLIACLWYLVE